MDPEPQARSCTLAISQVCVHGGTEYPPADQRAQEAGHRLFE